MIFPFSSRVISISKVYSTPIRNIIVRKTWTIGKLGVFIKQTLLGRRDQSVILNLVLQVPHFGRFENVQSTKFFTKAVLDHHVNHSIVIFFSVLGGVIDGRNKTVSSSLFK
eukprot:Lithocolla_globosa_v1_NODE_9850_length_662_cov_2.364086.p2 type:complete len:111 gc:universal NODE_9850_length_662_cov_2.364086:361-29(-)